MPARTGKEYILGLKERPSEVWIDGERDYSASRHQQSIGRARRSRLRYPAGPGNHQYLSTDTTNTRDRAQLFHLAWDVACSAFSGRQVLYERMFGGNAVRNASILFDNYDKEPFRKRVREFLESDN